MPKGIFLFFLFFEMVLTRTSLDPVVVEVNVDLVVIRVNHHPLVQHRLVRDNAVLSVVLDNCNTNLLQSDGSGNLHLAVVVSIPPLDSAVRQNLCLPLLTTEHIKLVGDLVVLPHSHKEGFSIKHPPSKGLLVGKSESVHRVSVVSVVSVDTI